MRLAAMLLCLLACAPALTAQGPLHAVATINDPRSHGQVGDNLLSLNEAIQLHNRDLQVAQLSLLEQQQISFIGGDIALADIDSTQVQTVTLERDLDVIANWPHGFNVRASPFVATIDIGSTAGFIVDSDFCDFRRIVIRGGSVAVRVLQRDTFYGSTFELVRFEGQTATAVQAYLSQNDGETYLQFEECTFVNIPTAVRIDDLGTNRRGLITMRGCTFDGGNEGFVLNLGPGGNSYTCRFERSLFQNQTAVGLLVRRPVAVADRGVALELTDLWSRNVPVGVWVDGHPTAPTTATVRMVSLAGGTAALRLGGTGTNTRIGIEDSTFTGPVNLGARTTLTLDNVRQTGGTLRLEGAAATTCAVRQSVLKNVTTTVTGASPVTFDGCRFDAGSISGTATATVAIQNSYTGTLATGANVTVTASLPNPQLGTTPVGQRQVLVGQTVDLDHDLPPGFFGLWLFGLGNDLPPAVMAGMRVYIEPATIAIYPGVWRGAGRVPFPVPPINALRSINLVFQMLVGHDVGIRGPMMQMPPGGRVMLR